jgi:hypothetical protein
MRISPVLILSKSVGDITTAMNDKSNWVNLLRHPEYNMAILRFILDNPSLLEFDLLPYPSDRFQKLHSDAHSEPAALFLDKRGRPVLVVCTQEVPDIIHLKRIRRKMSLLKATFGAMPRGILVHGGVRLYGDECEPRQNLIKESFEVPRVEIVHYVFDVDFKNQVRTAKRWL